ncbi:hypothetical protein [Kutzneria sp. CA-103260]|nr:hypothetical protein [Kutzneria sp. CA-103260]QUQ63831.1 hypothetical protein JJ691_15440 [Kutzneria sp. CA-103260]
MTNTRERGTQRQRLAAAFAAACPSNDLCQLLFWQPRQDLASAGSLDVT